MSSPISPLSTTTSASSSISTPSPNADVDKHAFLLASVQRQVERPTKLQCPTNTIAATTTLADKNGQTPMTTSVGNGDGSGAVGIIITSSPATPSSASAGGDGLVDGGGGGAGSMVTSPSFLPEMPQWKRDLIQRRKANAARAAAATATTGATHQHNEDGVGNGGGGGAAAVDGDGGGVVAADQQQASFHAIAAPDTYEVKSSSSLPQSNSNNNIKKQLKGNNSPTADITASSTSYKGALLTSPTTTTTSQQLEGGRAAAASGGGVAKQNAKLTNNYSNNSKLTSNSYTATTNTNKMPATSPTKTSAAPTTTTGGGHYTMEPQQRTTDLQDAIVSGNGDEGGAVSGGEHLEHQQQQQEECVPIPKQRSLYSPSNATTTIITTTVHTKEQQKQQEQAEESSNNVKHPTSPLTSPTTTTANAILHKLNGSATATTRLASSSAASSSASSASSAREPLESRSLASHSHFGVALGQRHSQSHSKYESERTSSHTPPSGSSSKVSATTATTRSDLACSLSGGGSSSSSVLSAEKTTVINPPAKISTKLQNNQFIKNQREQLLLNSGTGASGAGGVGGAVAVPSKLPPNKFNSMQIPAAQLNTTSTNGSPTKSAPKKKMVAVQEMKKQTSEAQPDVGTTKDFDPSEDLSYGPGIVSKLRCRYLSLALRQSMEKQRHCMDNMRRATSLNNLLDRCDDEDDDEDGGGGDHGETTDDGGEEAPLTPSSTATSASVTPVLRKGGILKNRESGGSAASAVAKKTATFEKNESKANGQRLSESLYGGKYSGGSGTGTVDANGAASESGRSSRQVKRGNDSLKRARSVEALLCERSPWNFVANRSSLGNAASGTPPTCVTIEDKIHNARDRMISGVDSMPPKRLTSIIDDTERPPPDLVKQTLKLFEASANKRGRGLNRGAANGKGEVATKVANYKSIIKEQKPAIVFPKPQQQSAGALSPTKKMPTNGLGPLKPAAKPVVAAADLLGSPIGRKTMASTLAGTPEPQLHSTPRPGSGSSYVSSIAGGLSEQTPDIIPRQKLPAAVESTAVDSPLTALSKKLEKLTIESSGKEASPAPTTKKLFATGGNGVGGDAPSAVAEDAVAAAAAAENKKRTVPIRRGSSDDTESASSTSGESDNDTDASEPDGGNHDDNKQLKSRKERRRSPRAASYSLVDDDEAAAGATDAVVTSGDIVQAGGPAAPASASGSSDQSDDDEYGRKKRDDRQTAVSAASTRNKHISQSALDNIAKAGTQQQFKFGSTTASGKQIGVIRPLHTQQQQPAVPGGITSTTTTTTTSTQQLTSREIEKNRINEMKKSSAAAIDSHSSTVAAAASASSATSLDTVINTNTGKLTSTSSASSSASSSPPSGYSELDAAMGGKTQNSPLWALRKKRPNPPASVAENTTMVFNFSNRKEVPDYIENDGGVIYRRKRELPKPNESGFVILNDLALETSTDTDYDDFAMCPPSPCDVEFENANIVIDGKSSIRQKTKDSMFRVQFNDTLTSTFEYPSESSLIVEDSFMDDPFFSAAAAAAVSSLKKAPANDEELLSAYENLSLGDTYHHHHVAANEIIPIPQRLGGAASAAPGNGGDGQSSPSKNILGNLPLGSAPLGSYTPTKAPLDNLFQLGITRAPSNASATTTNGNGTHDEAATTNGNGLYGVKSSSIVGIADGLNGDTPKDATFDDADKGEDDSSLQYLKPANDDPTMAYSEGTRKTDLLY